MATALVAIATSAALAQTTADPAVGVALRAEKTKLTMFTLNKVAFGGGVAQAAVASAAASAIANTDSVAPVTENDLDDPAQKLGAALAEAYAAKKGGHVAMTTFTLQKGAPAPDMSGAAYVVYIETVDWGAYYLPLNWTHYRVQYAAKFHIVETATGKELAKSSCRKFAKNEAAAPSFQELHADKGALLKALLASASDDCLQELKTRL